MNFYIYDTKIGKITIKEDDGIIKKITFGVESQGKYLETEVIKNTFLQIDEYLSGKRKFFSIEYNYKLTEFQNRVLMECLNVGYGKTISYKELAEKINNPKAVRAVGQALNKNPLPIIIPCHRIIGKNGKLTGFAGGVSIKESLLCLENASFEADGVK